MLHVTFSMQTPSLAFTALVVALGLLACHTAEAGARVTENFDAAWRFLKADAPGAEQPEFADGNWRKLDVPHDWSIEGPFSATNKTPLM